MTKPLASLSLDLDNRWSYMKTHGDEGWELYPSYLDVVVPRVLSLLAERDLRITFFVVGQDAALAVNRLALRAIANAGHEIGNHSFHHEPWLHLYDRHEIDDELQRTEDALLAATGRRPTGFRGPGFSFCDDLLQALAERGYAYDASTFPTFLGPLARAYYFFTAQLSREQQTQRKQLFGRFVEGFRPLRPYAWESTSPQLIELPVTTMPVLKIPIHMSYLLYLARISRSAAKLYFASALKLCRLLRIEPSLLLHPLDFLGCDDDVGLDFFPAMDRPARWKVDVTTSALDQLRRCFTVVAMDEHAAAARARLELSPASVPAASPTSSASSLPSAFS